MLEFDVFWLGLIDALLLDEDSGVVDLLHFSLSFHLKAVLVSNNSRSVFECLV